MTVTIAFFSSPPYRSLSEKKKTKQNKTKKQNQENETRKRIIVLALFRLKWLQIFSRFVISKESASYTIVPSIN